MATPPAPHTSLNLFFFKYYKVVMSGNPQIIMMAPAQRSGKGLKIMLVFGMFFMLLLIMLLFWVLYRRRRAENAEQSAASQQKRTRVTETSIGQVKDHVRKVAEDAGLDPDEMEDELDTQVANEVEKRCMVSPLRNGQCSPNYTLENGCCYPDASAPPNPNIARIDMVKNVAIGIGGGIVLDVILTAAIKKGVLAAKGTRVAASAGRVAATASKAARIAASAVKASVAAGKAAAMASKAALAAAGGPIGLAVLVVSIIFDVVSIILDELDQGGYESYTANSLLNRMKNIIDYETAKALEIEGIEYPLLFPLAVAYPEEFQAALEFTEAQISEKHLMAELEKDDQLLTLVANYAAAAVDNAEAPIPEDFVNFMAGLSKKFHLERDRLIFQKLQELLGNKAYMIEIYEDMSTPNRISVTLSQRGVQEWNDAAKGTWFANNDLFKQPDPPPAGEDPMSALFTDTYYVYESGPSDNPVMVPKKLSTKVALAGFYGPLVSYCEKSRKLKSTSATINPRDLGVKYNYETGMCDFTREYCSRYGMEFKGSDCKLRPGQGVAELIFGKTVTREFIRAFTSPPSYAKKSKGPATKGACPSGMRDDGMNCWLDPVYRGPGSPMGCKDGEEKKGQLCYPKCRPGYDSSALECEGSCPEGSENSGFHCTQWIHSYIPGNKSSNPLSAGFYQRADCRAGYKDRGTTCNEECLPDFDFKSGALGSAFCNKTRGRYSRAGDAKPLSSCPADKEKEGLLCYPKCSNKGANGQYKYNGVLDWCQPEGGAGIKKGLDDRWECPEGSSSIAGICYENCKPGERDDGLLCNPP
jgi:hypothetical protein